MKNPALAVKSACICPSKKDEIAVAFSVLLYFSDFTRREPDTNIF
jgi:hypothetical protein